MSRQQGEINMKRVATFIIMSVPVLGFLSILAILTMVALPDFSYEPEDIVLQDEDWVGFKSKKLEFKEMEGKIERLETLVKNDINPMIAMLENSSLKSGNVPDVMLLAKKSKEGVHELRGSLISIKHLLKTIQRPKVKMNSRDNQMDYDRNQEELMECFINIFPETINVIKETENVSRLAIGKYKTLSVVSQN